MRRLRLTPEAERALGEQLDYLIRQGARRAAESLSTRVQQFLFHTMAAYPKTGRYIPERDLWETWIPGTRIIAWYTFSDDELVVITFWHTAQNRRTS